MPEYKGGLKGKPGPNGRVEIDKPAMRIVPTKRTKASRVTDFNIHVRSTLPQDVPSEGYCNAPGYKSLCRMPAGSGTDHPGSGRCRTHQSRAPMELRRGGNALTDVRSRYGGGAPTTLKERYETLLQDQGLLEVTDEIAASKAMLSAIMNSVSEVDFDSEDGMDKALKFLSAFEKVTRLNLKYQELQKKGDFIITLPQFMKILKQLAVIAKEELADIDPAIRTKFLRRLASELDITGQSKLENEGAVEASYDVECENG